MLPLALNGLRAEAAVPACSGELDALQREVREFGDRAQAVDVAARQFERCSRSVAAATPVAGACRGEADRYRQAQTGLRKALDNADALVRTIDVRCLDAAQDAAPSDAAAPASSGAGGRPAMPSVKPGPTARPDDQSCALARTYKGRIPIEGVIKLCQQSLSEAACRRCLDLE